jgi:hypothetical protein
MPRKALQAEGMSIIAAAPTGKMRRLLEVMRATLGEDDSADLGPGVGQVLRFPELNERQQRALDVQGKRRE